MARGARPSRASRSRSPVRAGAAQGGARSRTGPPSFTPWKTYRRFVGISGLTVSHSAKPGGRADRSSIPTKDSVWFPAAVLPGARRPCRTGGPRARGEPLATHGRKAGRAETMARGARPSRASRSRSPVRAGAAQGGARSRTGPPSFTPWKTYRRFVGISGLTVSHSAKPGGRAGCKGCILSVFGLPSRRLQRPNRGHPSPFRCIGPRIRSRPIPG